MARTQIQAKIPLHGRSLPGNFGMFFDGFVKKELKRENEGGQKKKAKGTSFSRVTSVLLLRCASLGRTRGFIPPPWYKGGGDGWMEPLSGVFDVLQYFETILPLVESL